MEISVKINQTYHEDLVELLSTALEGNETFSARLLPAYAMMETRKEGETIYEKLANVIHYGGQIAVIDKEAFGKTHGPNKAVSSERLDTDDVEYRLSLEGVRNGIKLALEGHDARAKKAVHHFLANDETFDSDCADVLLQMCLFGEVVYG
jgi:hypothetical protein